MDTTGTIRLGDENLEFPIMEGTEAERAIDLRTLRAKSVTSPSMKATEILDPVRVPSLLSTENKASSATEATPLSN